MKNFCPKPTRTKAGLLSPAQYVATATTGNGVSFANKWDVNTDIVVVEVQTHNHIVTFDGTVPTATNGHTMYPGQPRTWAVDTATVATFLAVTGAGAIMGSQFMTPDGTVLTDTSVLGEIPI